MNCSFTCWIHLRWFAVTYTSFSRFRCSRLLFLHITGTKGNTQAWTSSSHDIAAAATDRSFCFPVVDISLCVSSVCLGSLRVTDISAAITVREAAEHWSLEGLEGLTPYFWGTQSVQCCDRQKTFDFLNKSYHSRRRNAHQNIAKFTMHFQPFQGNVKFTRGDYYSLLLSPLAHERAHQCGGEKRWGEGKSCFPSRHFFPRRRFSARPSFPSASRSAPWSPRMWRAPQSLAIIPSTKKRPPGLVRETSRW